MACLSFMPFYFMYIIYNLILYPFFVYLNHIFNFVNIFIPF
jgi:hypothetical protein